MWKDFLLSYLFKLLCEENGIEESIITITRFFKRKIIDTFLEKNSFVQIGNT